MAAVGLSIAGFIARGALMLRGSPLLKARFVRVAPHVVDTVLLASALWLCWLLREYPFVDGWLTAKVLGLLAYIALGTIALKRGRTPRVRAAAFVAALAAFGLHRLGGADARRARAARAARGRLRWRACPDSARRRPASTSRSRCSTPATAASRTRSRRWRSWCRTWRARAATTRRARRRARCCATSTAPGVQHHQDEEQDLFPLLRRYAGERGRGDVLAALDELAHEHRSMDDVYARIRARLDDVAEARSPRLDIEQVAHFAWLYRRHIMREEALAFGFAAEALTAAERAELGARMAARRGVGKA